MEKEETASESVTTMAEGTLQDGNKERGRSLGSGGRSRSRENGSFRKRRKGYEGDRPLIQRSRHPSPLSRRTASRDHSLRNRSYSPFYGATVSRRKQSNSSESEFHRRRHSPSYNRLSQRRRVDSKEAMSLRRRDTERFQRYSGRSKEAVRGHEGKSVREKLPLQEKHYTSYGSYSRDVSLVDDAAVLASEERRGVPDNASPLPYEGVAAAYGRAMFPSKAYGASSRDPYSTSAPTYHSHVSEERLMDGEEGMNASKALDEAKHGLNRRIEEKEEALPLEDETMAAPSFGKEPLYYGDSIESVYDDVSAEETHGQPFDAPQETVPHTEDPLEFEEDNAFFGGPPSHPYENLPHGYKDDTFGPSVQYPPYTAHKPLPYDSIHPSEFTGPHYPPNRPLFARTLGLQQRFPATDPPYGTLRPQYPYPRGRHYPRLPPLQEGGSTLPGYSNYDSYGSVRLTPAPGRPVAPYLAPPPHNIPLTQPTVYASAAARHSVNPQMMDLRGKRPLAYTPFRNTPVRGSGRPLYPATIPTLLHHPQPFSLNNRVTPSEGGERFPLEAPQMPHRRVKVKNLPIELCTMDALNSYFKMFGVIKNIDCEISQQSAYIEFSDSSSAARSLQHEPFGSPDIEISLVEESMGGSSQDYGNDAYTEAYSRMKRERGPSSAVFSNKYISSDYQKKKEQRIQQSKIKAELEKKQKALLQKLTDRLKEAMELSTAPTTPEDRRAFYRSQVQKIRHGIDSLAEEMNSHRRPKKTEEEVRLEEKLAKLEAEAAQEGVDTKRIFSTALKSSPYKLDYRTLFIKVTGIPEGITDQETLAEWVASHHDTLYGDAIDTFSLERDGEGGFFYACIKYVTRHIAEQVMRNRHNTDFKLEWLEDPIHRNTESDLLIVQQMGVSEMYEKVSPLQGSSELLENGAAIVDPLHLVNYIRHHENEVDYGDDV